MTDHPPIVFVDTETTSLRPDRRAWEVALIVRDGAGHDRELTWFVDLDDLELDNADPFALRVGRFHDRHPAAANGWQRRRRVVGIYDALDATTPESPESRVAALVEAHTRGAHLVGAVPNFDAEVLGAMLRRHGLLPAWHYHLIDVETLAVGWLAARGQPVPLPWKSDELAAACGVPPVAPDQRHTALGDARWARDIYDTITDADRMVTE